MASELLTTPDVADGITPAASSALLADVIEVLLPGDESWPSARVVGVQAFVAVRTPRRARQSGVSEAYVGFACCGRAFRWAR